MSADNGIYILKLKDQYRIIEAQAIDNLYWNPDSNTEQPDINLKQVVSYYGHAPSFDTRNAALEKAGQMLDDVYVCEYGINFINDLEKYTWDEIVKMANPKGKIKIVELKPNSFDFTIAGIILAICMGVFIGGLVLIGYLIKHFAN